MSEELVSEELVSEELVSEELVSEELVSEELVSEELVSEDAGGAGIDVDAVVVGAGLGGLYMLYKLRELGLSAQAFEAGDGVGGDVVLESVSGGAL